MDRSEWAGSMSTLYVQAQRLKSAWCAWGLRGETMGRRGRVIATRDGAQPRAPQTQRHTLWPHPTGPPSHPPLADIPLSCGTPDLEIFLQKVNEIMRYHALTPLCVTKCSKISLLYDKPLSTAKPRLYITTLQLLCKSYAVGAGYLDLSLPFSSMEPWYFLDQLSASWGLVNDG